MRLKILKKNELELNLISLGNKFLTYIDKRKDNDYN